MSVRRAAVVAAIGGAIFLLAAAATGGGLVDDEPYVDVHLYERFAERMLAVELPYRDFFVEYPPGSIPTFLVPRVAPAGHYQTAFRVEMAVMGLLALGAVVAVLARLRVGRAHAVLAVATVALAPLYLGPILLNGYDLWPTVLAVAALAALVFRRLLLGHGLLGVAAAAKVFPLALLPLFLLRVAVEQGRRGLVRALAAFVATAGVLVGAFFALAPGGVGFSFWVQAKRGLQNESLGGSLLLALDHAGLYDARLEVAPPGSLDLVGALPDAVAAASGLAQLVAVAAVAVLAHRAVLGNDETLLTAAAASVAAFVAFGKVFSPQYLVWLVPFAALAPGRAGRGAAALLVGAGILTQLWVTGALSPFEDGASIWAVVARNALVAAAYTLLVAGLRRREPAARGRIAATSTA